MPYPVLVIPFDQYLTYVNNNWVTNGQGDITGVIGNNVVNALYQYVYKAPFNSQLVTVVSQSSPYTAINGITRFSGTAPASLAFGDNVWNEWQFINATSSPIPFTSGLGYFDINNSFRTSIPARSTIRIGKATNSQWVQTGGDAAGGQVVTSLRDYPQFTVGAAGAPTLTNNGKTLTILDNDIINDLPSIEVHLVPNIVPQTYVPNFNEYFAYTPVYSTGKLSITWNETLPNTSVVIIKYPVRFILSCPPVSPANDYTAQTVDVETQTLLDIYGSIFTILEGTQGGAIIKLWAVNAADETERLYAVYKYYASKIGEVVTISYSGGDGIMWQSFGEDLYNNIVFSKDDTLGGIKIQVTGLLNKTINWNAKISYDSSDL